MALANEYMLEELTAEEIYQKKLTAGTNITIDNQNVISATGGGSSVQYTSNYAQGDILGTLSIDGASSAVRTPNLVEGENITITRNQQAGTITISSSAGSGDLSAHELTEEAYNVLTPAEKTNGELYLTHPATVGSSEPNKIYYNDTLYGTEGGNDVVELTQAQWDALPSSKLTDGIIYVITDVAGSGSYNTLGVPMTHIDGSEQVVGTLFGETLYQKSYQTTVTVTSTARAWYTLVTSSQLRVINADKVLIDATHSFIELNDSIINLNYSSIVNAAGGIAGCSYASTEDEVQVCLYGFTADTYPATVTIQYTKSTS